MKAYQRSMREESKFQYKRSGSTRNWRQRKVMKAYQDSWDQRCRVLFCCMRATDSNRNSFREIARLLSDYFRDLDVVPTDVVAGIILLRIYQKIERRAIIERRKNDTYEFLSGVPVTSSTKFLSLQEGGADLCLFQTVIRYVYFAGRAPDALRTRQHRDHLRYLSRRYRTDAVFYRARLRSRKNRDKHTRNAKHEGHSHDLNAEAERIPVEPLRDDFLGHKGMVSAAVYILEKIKSEKLLERAHNYRTFIGTKDYDLVIVGHSLGAGIASILGILLRKEYPNLTCFCYSPPGGLLRLVKTVRMIMSNWGVCYCSMAAMEYTRGFTTGVVLGKDVVPRLGLNQMEALRADLINAIKRSVDPKWKIISCGVMCCCCSIEPTSATELSTADQAMADYIHEKKQTRTVGGVHPSDSTIALTTHLPMYPPGRIVHIVRHHPTKDEQKYEQSWRKALSGNEPVYQAIWAENTDFDEVLISPVMIQDHMPDKLLTALNKVVINMGPRKPRRLNINEIWNDYKNEEQPERHNFCLETCFTTFPEPKAVAAPAPLKLDLVKKTAAPLAQPEYFSDTSSLTSIASNWESATAVVQVESNNTERYSQSMKRTPKIIGNLSTCVDDIRNVKTFEKLNKNQSNSSSTSGLSTKTNCSNDNEHYVGINQCSWQRQCIETTKVSSLAEDLLEEILEYAECAEFFKSDSLLSDYGEELLDGENLDKKEKTTSPLILSPSSLDIDPDVISNYAIDLNLDQEHRSLLSYQHLQTSILKVSQAGACNGSHSPLCSKTVTFNPDVQSIDDKIFLDRTDYLDRKRDRFRLFNFVHWRYFKKFKRTNSESDLEAYVSTISSENICVKAKTRSRKENLPLLNIEKSNAEHT
ncbi:hypothetical protein FQR65_LT11072 [Abscondita terminalis]|nr:hypothetical protein FQR65_LT11072 [Abscondita terminalis]